MHIGRFVLNRLILTVITLVLLSLAVFFLAQVLPGDIARQILGPYAAPEQVDMLNERLGTYDPFLDRYLSWAGGFITGNWGVSPILGVPVQTVLADATLKSFQLALLAFIIVLAISFFFGIRAAKRAGSVRDAIVNYTAVGIGGIPEMVTSVIFIAVFAVALRWFPSSAQTTSDSPFVQLYHILLPALALAPTTIGYTLRIVRAQAIDVFSSDYVRTATLKGASPARIEVRHAFKNILSPISPVLGANFIYLVTGIVAIERLFNYPALGTALFNAAISKDVVVLATGTMIAASIVILVNLLADVIMVLLNPKAQRGDQ